MPLGNVSASQGDQLLSTSCRGDSRSRMHTSRTLPQLAAINTGRSESGIDLSAPALYRSLHHGSRSRYAGSMEVPRSNPGGSGGISNRREAMCHEAPLLGTAAASSHRCHQRILPAARQLPQGPWRRPGASPRPRRSRCFPSSTPSRCLGPGRRRWATSRRACRCPLPPPLASPDPSSTSVSQAAPASSPCPPPDPIRPPFPLPDGRYRTQRGPAPLGRRRCRQLAAWAVAAAAVARQRRQAGRRRRAPPDPIRGSAGPAVGLLRLSLRHGPSLGPKEHPRQHAAAPDRRGRPDSRWLLAPVLATHPPGGRGPEQGRRRGLRGPHPPPHPKKVDPLVISCRHPRFLRTFLFYFTDRTLVLWYLFVPVYSISLWVGAAPAAALPLPYICRRSSLWLHSLHH